MPVRTTRSKVHLWLAVWAFHSFPSLSSFIILFLLLPTHLPPCPAAQGLLRHILRTHSHRAVIRRDSTLRLVFCFHCIHLFKKKRNRIWCSFLLNWISCSWMEEVYDEEGRCLSEGGKRRYPREAAEPPKWGGKAQEGGKKGKKKEAWSGRSTERRTKRRGQDGGPGCCPSFVQTYQGESAERELYNHISIQADNGSLRPDNGSFLPM